MKPIWSSPVDEQSHRLLVKRGCIKIHDVLGFACSFVLECHLGAQFSPPHILIDVILECVTRKKQESRSDNCDLVCLSCLFGLWQNERSIWCDRVSGLRLSHWLWSWPSGITSILNSDFLNAGPNRVLFQRRIVPALRLTLSDTLIWM